MVRKPQHVRALRTTVTQAESLNLEQIKLIKAPHAASVAMRQFFRIADQWSLTRLERCRILSVSESTLRRYARSQFARGLRRPVVVRLSLVFNVYEATRTLMADPGRAHEWMRLPNQASAFEGRSALDLMLAGLDGSVVVWTYLSGQILE